MSSVFDALQLQRIAQAIEDGYAGGGTLTVDVTGAGDMQGATAGTAGVHGLVPAPQAGDEGKVLTGAGTWETPAAGGGGLPDYSNVITSGSYSTYDGFNYTAVDDCFVFVMIGCSSPLSYPHVSVNNNQLGYLWGQTSGVEMPIMMPLKSGDVLDISAVNQGESWTENYIIFGI